MTVYRFTVEGNPVPKERPRVVKGHTYTPARTLRYEAQVKALARRARIPMLSGKVKLCLSFYRETHHCCDIDNLVKAVQDALNGIAYRDDRQIVWLSAMKHVDEGNPRTEVEVCEVAWGVDEDMEAA